MIPRTERDQDELVGAVRGYVGFLRGNKLAITVFDGYDAIIAK